MLTLEDTSSRRLNSRLLVVVAIAFPMTFFVPSWNAINLICYFFLLLLISIKNITTGFLLVTFFSFWIGLLRWDNKDNLLPSIVDSASLIILIAALLIKYLLRPTKLKLRFHPTSFALLACLICIAAINLAVVADILLRSDDAIEIALKIREYVLPSFTFFIALTAFSNHKNAAAKYVSIITIAGGLVATLNIVHYIYGLPLFIPRFVPQHGLENVFVSRELFGLSFYRMHHILGLSTQGGGGAIYMGIALIALVLFFKGKQYRPLWLFCFISTLACAILIVSFSALLVLCLFIATLPIITGLHKPLIFFATLPVGATLISLLALGNLLTRQSNSQITERSERTHG